MRKVAEELMEHQKRVIQNVSSDRQLFSKELKKSSMWLQNNELAKLKSWVIENYKNIYPDIIRHVFGEKAA